MHSRPNAPVPVPLSPFILRHLLRPLLLRLAYFRGSCYFVPTFACVFALTFLSGLTRLNHGVVASSSDARAQSRVIERTDEELILYETRSKTKDANEKERGERNR